MCIRDRSKQELEQVKDKWQKDYPDDSQLNQIVNQTYAYHLSHLNEPVVKDGSVYMQKTRPRKTFQFDDENEQKDFFQESTPQEKKEEDTSSTKKQTFSRCV